MTRQPKSTDADLVYDLRQNDLTALSPIDRLVRVGVRGDLRKLHADAGSPTARESGKALEAVIPGWSIDDAGRLQRAARSASLERYLALVRYYFSLTPEHRWANHPAVPLLDLPEIAGLLRMQRRTDGKEPLMLYDYLGVVYQMAQFRPELRDHPAYGLFLYFTEIYNKSGADTLIG